MTTLPDVDTEQAAEFWQRAIEAGAVPTGTPLPSMIEPFGDSVELADELLALVLDGPKRATAGSYDEYVLDGSTIPEVGTYSVSTDGSGRARAVLLTTDVRIGPLSSVDDQFAWDEGEDDRTRGSWLAAHEAFFRRWLPQIGLEYSDDMPTVFERFDVVYVER